METLLRIVPGTKEESIALSAAINAYNLSQVPFHRNPPWESMYFLLKDEEGTPMGGITGVLIMDYCLSIEVLWIHESCREQGWGSKLMQTMEEAAYNKGARLVQLDTFDFQALDFYKKLGYEIFGTLEDCPIPEHKRYYLKKRLNKTP